MTVRCGLRATLLAALAGVVLAGCGSDSSVSVFIPVTRTAGTNPSPTATATAPPVTATATVTLTAARPATSTATVAATRTASRTATPPSPTATASVPPSATMPPAATVTGVPSATSTATLVPSASATVPPPATASPTAPATAIPTATATATGVPTGTVAATATATRTATIAVTASFTPTATPTTGGGAVCGNRVLEAGETCASCPADCVVGPCSTPGTPTGAFVVDLVAPIGFQPTTATVLLAYDSRRLSLPGSGTATTVRQRVVAPPPVPQAFTPNDLDYAVRVLVSRNVPLGTLFTATFDACAGAATPSLADLACSVEGCAAGGSPVPGCTCAVRLP